MDHPSTSTDTSETLRLRIPAALAVLIGDVFTVSLVTLTVLYLLDQLIQGFASDELVMSVGVTVVLVSGLLTGLFRLQPAAQTDRSSAVGMVSSLHVMVIGLLVTAVVYFAAAKLGWVRWPLAIFSGVTAAGMFWTLLAETNNERET